MNIYFEPVNLKQWNMFEMVSGIGHIEAFLATKSMKVGDIVLLHVGKQFPTVRSGVYAYGFIVEPPSIYLGNQEEQCYGNLSVMVRIARIERGEPLINEDECKEIFAQFRSVHRVNEIYFDKILKMINQSINKEKIY